eukprot:TRINITY_DN3418_c0_g1_i1.p1 TRINITY_DN3418_c0_g1~~TRINITY_DN3418_c0_g1_i1.p1  ORF type:complete len:306 (+),score=80.69 TRINITY_DN3418_c0_g1_i1:96-1013(+)
MLPIQDPITFPFDRSSLITREHFQSSFHHIQFKVSHNSQQRGEAIIMQLEEGGCQGLEFDLVIDPNSLQDERWRFHAQHDEYYTGRSPLLNQFLKEIRSWSIANPDHIALTVVLDMKDGATIGDDDRFVQELDSLLREEIGRDMIFTPNDLRGSHDHLVASVKNGWPPLWTLRGKLIFIISGSDRSLRVRRRRNYYAMSGNDRLAFVDLDQRVLSSIEDLEKQQHRVFINLQFGLKGWKEMALKAKEMGMITRVWKANHEDHWHLCVGSLINMIATDRITDSHWAKMGNDRFISPEHKQEKKDEL